LFGYYNEAHSNGLYVEDASQYWKPFKVKDVACYSLYANKLITCGEGGIVVTNNKKYYERAKSYRNLCHSKERFVHNDIGYNFRISNLQAAVALAQLEQIDTFTQIKQNNKYWYQRYLPLGATCLFDVEIPWMYLIWVKDAKKVANQMGKKGLDCRRFFYPIWSQKCWNRSSGIFLENTQREDINYGMNLWKHLMYLPSGLTLTEKKIKHICTTLEEVLDNGKDFCHHSDTQ
jgi:perosamine synthetase